MGKVIVMILVAFGAQAHAKEQDKFGLLPMDAQDVELADALGQRAFGVVGFVDGEGLDGTTLGKGAAAGKVPRSAPSRGGGGGGAADLKARREGTLRGADGRRVFGGTTKLMAGAGLPIQQPPKAPAFWDALGTSATSTSRVKDDGVDLKTRDGKLRNKEGRRVFGGTTKLLAGEGKAIMEDNKPPSFWGR